MSLSRHLQLFHWLCPSLLHGNKVQTSAFELVHLWDELLDLVIACQRLRVFLDHRDCDFFLMVEVSLRVVRFVVSCLGPIVVGPRCGCVVKTNLHFSVYCFEFSSSSTLAFSSWRSVGVGSVLGELSETRCWLERLCFDVCVDS